MADPNLDKTLLSSIAWMAGARYLGQILRWGSTIFVVRWLMPEDFGLFGLAIVVVEMLALLCEFALETAVVTLDLDDKRLRQVNSLCMILGVLGFLLVAALAVPLAWALGAPELPVPLIVTGLVLVIKPMQSVPMSVLRKRMQFKRLAAYEALDAFVLPILSLVLAYLGFGYWTLVVAYLAQNAVSVLLILSHLRYPFAWPRWADLRSTLVYCWHVSVQRVSWFFYNHVDTIIGGKLLGEKVLGFYRVGLNMANKPMEQLAVMFTRVAPSFFAAVKDDVPALRRYFLRLTEGVALVNFAACFGLALVSDQFVMALWGEKWEMAIEPLRVLSMFAAWRSIEPLFHQIVIVTNEERFAGRMSLFASVVLPLAFWAGCEYGGVGGLSWSWVFAYPPVFLPVYARVFKRLDMDMRLYLKSLWPATACSVVMTAAVLAMKWYGPRSESALAQLGIEVAVGGAAYLGVLGLFFRHRIHAVFKTVRAPT